MPYVAVGIGAALGANARYLVSILVAERLGAQFPYGTLLINVSGSLLIGFLLTFLVERLTISPLWRLFIATGFLGGYTTFSTYTYEAALLLRVGEVSQALLYLLGSVVLGMVAVFAGIVAARLLS